MMKLAWVAEAPTTSSDAIGRVTNEGPWEERPRLVDCDMARPKEAGVRIQRFIPGR